LGATRCSIPITREKVLPWPTRLGEPTILMESQDPTTRK
jgi:hypothetical protein